MLHDKSLDGTPIHLLSKGSEKKVAYTCDKCGIEKTLTYHNYTSRRTAGDKTYCKKCACQLSGLRKRGRKLKRTRPSPIGAKHHSWRGGRFIASDGYVKIWIAPRKHRKEHFLVLEEFLQRPLLPDEVVHHIDGNKTNNELENLALLTNESQHRNVHNSLYNLSCFLVQKGLIGFDRNSNTYMAVDKLRELLEQPEEANQQPSDDGNVVERFND